MFAARNMMFASAAFSPLSLSPALWLDASDASTLYDSTVGGSLVAADGTVARWEDKSGNGRHAAQATGVSQPQRKTAIKNGKDVVLFDGANDWLATSAFGGTETFTRFVVVATLVSQYKVICAHGGSFISPNPGADYMAINSSYRPEIIQNGGGTAATLSTKLRTASNPGAGEFFSFTQFCDGTNAGNAMKINGADGTISNPNTNNPGAFTKAATAYGIGAYNGGGGPCNCYIAELLHFPSALSEANRASVEGYLNAKWALY